MEIAASKIQVLSESVPGCETVFILGILEGETGGSDDEGPD